MASHLMKTHPHMGHEVQEKASEQPPKLGVAIAPVAEADLASLGIEYGIRVDSVVPASIAQKAGLRIGDVVMKINDRPVYSTDRMQYLVSKAKDRVAVTVLRDGENLQLSAEFPKPAIAATGRAALGVRIQPMTADLREAFGAETDRGILVSQVMPDSAAGLAGIKAGDIVVAVNGTDIGSVRELHTVLGRFSPGDAVDVAVVRERAPKSLQVALGAMPMNPHRPGKQAQTDKRHYKHHPDYGMHGRQGMVMPHGCSYHKKYRAS
jgi:S1-C subfamily serine protease